jgi:hypothetical protein
MGAPSQPGLHLRWEKLTYDVAVETSTPAVTPAELHGAAATEEGAAAAPAPPTPPGV